MARSMLVMQRHDSFNILAPHPGKVTSIFALTFSSKGPFLHKGGKHINQLLHQDKPAGDVCEEEEWATEEGVRALGAVRRGGRSHRLLKPWPSLRVLQQLQGVGVHRKNNLQILKKRRLTLVFDSCTASNVSVISICFKTVEFQKSLQLDDYFHPKMPLYLYELPQSQRFVYFLKHEKPREV